MRSTGPSVDVKSWIVCWCVCIGVGIGGKDGPALFDLGGAARYRQALVFVCCSGVSPGLSQEWLTNGEWRPGREAVPCCAILRDGGPLRESQWETEVLQVPG